MTLAATGLWQGWLVTKNSSYWVGSCIAAKKADTLKKHIFFMWKMVKVFPPAWINNRHVFVCANQAPEIIGDLAFIWENSVII